jgi:cholesterol transport system auxiliary component
MNKRVLATCALALVMTACVHTNTARFVQHYTLTAGAPGPGATQTGIRSADKILQIARIDVPDWLAGTAMYYRLDYRADGRLATYADSDWIAPPATLLEPLLEKTIAAGGGWRAVIGPRNLASADVSLQLRLDDFAQNFSGPRQSSGVIDATATLVSDRDGHVIAQRHFRLGAPAPTPDAEGGAKALGRASARFAAELQRWLQQTH